MPTTRRRTTTDPALSRVVDTVHALAQAEVDKLQAVLAWAVEHSIDEEHHAATYDDTDLPLAGAGAPWVAEFAVCDLGLALGVSTEAARTYLGRALELAHRLPRLYARVVALEVPVWRAGRIAEATLVLPMAGARSVDRDLAPVAHNTTWAALDRLVEAALVRFDPDEAEARRLKALETRKADVHLRYGETTGTVEVSATMDTVDALDLDTALAKRAHELLTEGHTESLDVRRSIALGDLARRYLASDPSESGTGRAVTIYAHVTAGSTLAMLDNTGVNVLATQVADWCGTATKVTIKPVIDLNVDESASTYAIPERIREKVQLIHPTCVFPHCGRPSKSCDLDHRTPWPDGATSTQNLSPLCRRHHRFKTHGGWDHPDP